MAGKRVWGRDDPCGGAYYGLFRERSFRGRSVQHRKDAITNHAGMQQLADVIDGACCLCPKTVLIAAVDAASTAATAKMVPWQPGERSWNSRRVLSERYPNGESREATAMCGWHRSGCPLSQNRRLAQARGFCGRKRRAPAREGESVPGSVHAPSRRGADREGEGGSLMIMFTNQREHEREQARKSSG